MTDSTDPNVERVACSQSDVYLSNLPEKDRATFLRTSGNVDLEADIRLLRTIITSLLEDLCSNYRYFAVLFNALCRVIGLQVKSRASTEDLEEAMLQAAEDALREMEAESHDGRTQQERLS